MRYFFLLDFQHWVLALFLGLLAVIFIYIAWRLYPDPEVREEAAGERLHTGHTVSSHPIAPILIVIYIGAVLWALGYAVVVGIMGGAIS